MKGLLTITGFLFNIHLMFSQADTAFISRNITFSGFMNMVKDKNISYAAEKFNVSAADAAVEIARIIPDPYAAFDMAGSREGGESAGFDYSSEVGTTIELGGKRRARIDLAKSERDLARAELADFFRNLQADAALIYLVAERQRQVFDVGLNSYQTMKRLSEADSIRFQLGTIMKIDAIQSRLEAGALYNDLLHSAIEWKNSLLGISLVTGRDENDTLLVPQKQPGLKCRIFSLEDLTTVALNNRADIIAARANRDVSENALRLARKEKMIDMDLRAGISNSYVSGIRSASGVSGGVEVPLKFSGFSRGTIKMAQAMVGQAEELNRLVENQIRTDISQALNLYYVHCRQVENYENGLLKMASDVLKGKLYSYERGETSLLDVLNAQRTYNEIQVTYHNALYDMAAALVNLERSAGIWDLDF